MKEYINIQKLCTNNMGKHIVIIGNGISGITCARHIRKKSRHQITVISSESEYFFSRTALMYVYMGHMKFEHTKPYEDHFWKKNDIILIKDHVQFVDKGNKLLLLSSGSTIKYDILIIATGAKPNKFGWFGQDLKGVQGLYHWQDVQQMEKNTKDISRAVIVGGGLIGIEMAEMLHSRNIPVTFLVRGENFWGSVLPTDEAKMIERHILEHHIDLRMNTELKEILGDSEERVSAVITSKGEEIPCEFVGLTAGVAPNIDFLVNSGIETKRGVLINEYFETNIPDIYAIGDCAEFRISLPGRKPVEQVWYTGRMHGETLAQTICGKRTAYSPGHWFNSAKFFNIEYQTYGKVSPKLEENESAFYWEHTEGKICFRAVYDKATEQLIGVNVFGFRLRHEVLDRWLTEGRTVEYIVEHLQEANFDPEFFHRHEPSIIQSFHENRTAVNV